MDVSLGATIQPTAEACADSILFALVLPSGPLLPGGQYAVWVFSRRMFEQ